MKEKEPTIFGQIKSFESEVVRLEGRLLELETRIDQLIQIERNHLIRVKNHEEITDDFIQQGRRYLDLSPEKAWKQYQNKDFDFVLIDVSPKDTSAFRKIPEAIHMPWEDFGERFLELQTKTTPIMIISEDGTHSVLACEYLVKRGFYNCSNISGGHKFWKGFRLEEVKEESA